MSANWKAPVIRKISALITDTCALHMKMLPSAIQLKPFLLSHVDPTKPPWGAAPKDKSSQPVSLQAILLLYLFLWATSHYVEFEKPVQPDKIIVRRCWKEKSFTSFGLMIVLCAYLNPCVSVFLTGLAFLSCPPVTWRSRLWLLSNAWTLWCR